MNRLKLLVPRRKKMNPYDVDNNNNNKDVSLQCDVDSNFDDERLMTPSQPPQRQLLPQKIMHEPSTTTTTTAQNID